MLFYIRMYQSTNTTRGDACVNMHCVTGLVVVVFCCLLNWCDDGPNRQENLRLDQLLEDGLTVPVPAGGVANCLLQLFPGLVGIGYTAHLCVEVGGKLTLYRSNTNLPSHHAYKISRDKYSALEGAADASMTDCTWCLAAFLSLASLIMTCFKCASLLGG